MAKSPPSKSSISSNRLLSALADDDQRLVEPHLTAVPLAERQVLETAGEPVESVYFPEAGIVSVVANGKGNREIEVGIIGREGMTGVSAVLGADYPTNVTYVQVAGHGQRISAAKLTNLMDRSPSLRRLLLRAVNVFISHISRTAFANGREKMEARLARWLLMAQDRLDGNEVPLTHEFLSIMLGTARPGVTVVLEALERKSLITLKRKRIVIENRRGLEKVSNGSYGVAEAEMERLLAG